jgi:hypothetical protein
MNFSITSFEVFMIDLFHIKWTWKKHFPTWPPQSWMIFCEIVVPVKIGIPAHFTVVWPLEFCEQTYKIVKKVVFFWGPGGGRHKFPYKEWHNFFPNWDILCIVLYCIYFGPRNPEDIGQVNVQQYKPQNN